MTLENQVCPHLPIHHSQQGGFHPLHRFNEIGCALSPTPHDGHEGRCPSLVGKGYGAASFIMIQNARTSK